MTKYGQTPLDDEILRSAVSYFTGLRRTFDFKGLSTRREFWGFQFFQILILFLLYLGSQGSEFVSNLSNILYVVGFISSVSLTIRRLRDVGKSWLWLIPCLFPVVNFVVWVTFLLKPTPGWQPSEDEEYWWNPGTWKGGFAFLWWGGD